MKIKSKSIVALFLVVMTIATMFVPAMAMNTTGQTPVSLTSEAAIFNVSVPTVLPVGADEQGNITVANDVKISNSSWGPIYIAGLDVTAQNSWAIDGYDTSAMYAEKVDTKKIAMVINNCKTTSTGSIAYAVENFPRLEGRGGHNWIGIDYFAKLPAQHTALNKVVPMSVVFTIAWLTASSPSTVPENTNETSSNLDLINAPEALSIGDKASVTAVQDSGTFAWTNSNPSVIALTTGTTGLSSFLDSLVLTTNAAEDLVKSTVELEALKLGQTTITVTNETGDEESLSLYVVKNEIDGLSIISMPDKTAYKPGENFSPAGMVLEGHYTNGDSYIIDSYSYDANPIVDGQASIDVWYTEQGIKKTVTLPISVIGKALTGINVTTAPAKIQYNKGEGFLSAGMVVTAAYDDGSTGDVTGYTYPVTAFIGGETSVTISYNGKTCTTPVTVITAAPVLANITDFYTFYDDTATTGGYKIALTTTFRAALVSNSGNSVAYKGWTPGSPLPNPGSIYNGKPVTSCYNIFRYIDDVNDFKVKSLDLSKWDTSNLVSMERMFSGARYVTSINFGSMDTSNVKNMSFMFSLCDSLTSLNLSTFNTSNVTNMYGMFSGVGNLTTLDLSGFDTSKVTNMGWMFSNCGVTSLDLSTFNTSSVVNMSCMFGLRNATWLNISSFNTSNVTDMSYMFYVSGQLASLDLSNFDTINVKNMCSMFNSCTALASINLNSFDTTNVTNMGQMFYNCSKLTTLDLSSFSTSVVTASTDMFNACTLIRTAYARSASDVTKLNASSNKPTTFTFVIKP